MQPTRKVIIHPDKEGIKGRMRDFDLQSLFDSLSCEWFEQIHAVIKYNSMKCIDIDSNTTEWRLVDYQLQLATGKSSIRMISLKYFEDYSNRSFDNRQGTDAIVHTTDFNKEYCQKVLLKTIPLEDVLFYCGHLNIHGYANIPSKLFSAYLCKVNLGRIGYQQDAHCNSILIEPDSEQAAFQYNFFVNSHAQYEVKYEVSFMVSDDKQFKLADLECSSCQNRIPTTYCKSQKLFFCEDCGREHHSKKLMQYHQLQQLNKINTLPLCKNHNLKNEFYCARCEKYICHTCTQKGQHQENNEHPVKPISYFYDEKRENIEFLPKKHCENIQSLLVKLAAKKEEIEANYGEVYRYIENQYEKSKKKLDQLMAEKMSSLDSFEIELKMLNERLEWSKAFIKFQEKHLKPIHYFQSVQRFEDELSELKINDFQGIFVAKADLGVQGSILVDTKDILDRSRREPQTTLDPTVSESKQNKSLYEYNPDSQAPKKGDLSLMLENSGLNFFQISGR